MVNAKMAKKKEESETPVADDADVEEDVAPLGLPPIDEKLLSKFKKKGKGSTSDDDESSTDSNKTSISANLSPEVSIEIEKIKAQIEAMNQMRAMFNERFSTISEQIGELRTMVVSQEQEFSELEVKSAKANEIMSQIEPERFLSEISKLDMRIEAIKGKIESNEAVNQMIMKELKDQRSKMSMFKGIEDTIKLNKEVREELMMIKKVEANIDVHANKVESMFMQVQKRFNEFEKFRGMTEDLNAAFKEQMQEHDNIKVKITEFISQDDFNKSKEELEKSMLGFTERFKAMENVAADINKLVTAEKFLEFRDKSLNVLKEHQKSIATIAELRAMLAQLRERVDNSEVPDMESLKAVFAGHENTKALKDELENLREVMTYGFKRVQQIESKMFVEKETYETIRGIVKKYLEKGYTKKQIVDAFELQGWPRNLIKQYVG